MQSIGRGGLTVAAAIVLSLLASAVVGWLGDRTDDEGIMLGIILLVAGALGVLFPRWWLATGTIVALGIPAAYLVWPLFGYVPHYHEPVSNAYGTLLIVIPAAAASAAGMGLRRFIVPLRD